MGYPRGVTAENVGDYELIRDARKTLQGLIEGIQASHFYLFRPAVPSPLMKMLKEEEINLGMALRAFKK